MTLHTSAATLVALLAVSSPLGMTPTQHALVPPLSAGTADTRTQITMEQGTDAQLGALQHAYRSASWAARLGLHNEIQLLINVPGPAD